MTNIKSHTSDMISKGLKFTRRPDLTPELRLDIAYSAPEAQQNGKWGKSRH